MKKFQWRSFFAGVLSTVLVLGLSATAFAAAGGQINFSMVNVVLNGQQISAAGEGYDPGSGVIAPSSLSYVDETGGSTTYLPVRRLSELLGIPITWDGTTSSVVIGDAPAPTAPETPVTPPAQTLGFPDVSVQLVTVCFDMNSVGGVTPEVYFQNLSGKTIKYIDFTFVPYNRVGDVASCTVTGQSAMKMECVGPIEPFETGRKLYFFWENGKRVLVENDGTGVYKFVDDARRQLSPAEMLCVAAGNEVDKNGHIVLNRGHYVGDSVFWYNSGIGWITVSQIDITYMDNTTETIYNPSAYNLLH